MGIRPAQANGKIVYVLVNRDSGDGFVTAIDHTTESLGTPIDFTNANLSSTDLSLTNFYSANFTGANLTGANVTNMVFTSATLTGINATDLIGTTAYLPENWNFGGTTLTGPGMNPVA